VKSNLIYATSLVNSFDIICFQEHWLFEFQKNELDKFKGKDFFARCSDTYDQISAFSLPRGKGGVAIAWPQALSSKITRLSEGNARVMGILIAINPKVCVIGTYMPTNNPLVNLSIEYAECLDIIQHMVMTYKESHEIIIIGDLNGTLSTPRNFNRHDVLLQSFVHELGIHVEHSEKQTFFHHSGASTSQIDYI
jgi:exonuclease III